MVYLASPYSANPQKNYEDVLRYVKKYFLEEGIILFSPIIYCHNIKLSANHLGIEYYKDFDLMMLSKADELWVLKLDGWETSEGVVQEIEFAKQNGIKIRYIEV